MKNNTEMKSALDLVPSNLLKKLEKAHLSALSNPRTKTPEAPQKQKKVVQFPVWPEMVRGIPNSVLRSALFGIVRRGRRPYLERQELAAIDGVKIIFTGPRLDQADLDVWEECLHISRVNNIGNKIYFTAHGFLKKINRATGKSQYEWLKGAFARLSTSAVEVTDGKKTYFGAMIHGGARDDETGQYFIEINPKIMSLYGHDGWTGIDFEQRLALKSQPLSQWLHGFYSTHAKPYPYKVATLRELCGSEIKELWRFRQQLKKSFTQVSKVTSWKIWIDDKDLVHVEKLTRHSR